MFMLLWMRKLTPIEGLILGTLYPDLSHKMVKGPPLWFSQFTNDRLTYKLPDVSQGRVYGRTELCNKKPGSSGKYPHPSPTPPTGGGSIEAQPVWKPIIILSTQSRFAKLVKKPMAQRGKNLGEYMIPRR
jgi:hypothetical protein